MLRQFATAAALGALVVASPLRLAEADQITIGNSTSGEWTFTGLGGGSLSVSQTAMSGPAFDATEATVGSYTLSGWGPVTVTNDGTGVFPMSQVATFTYTNGGNSVTEAVTWTSINDNSHNPHFEGSDVVTAISGSAAFEAAYGPVGGATHIDITTTQVADTLDALALTTATETASISSGEDVRLVPEPATLALLGTSLLGFGLLRRRR